MKDIRYSIIIYADEFENFSRCIESILEQKYNLSKIELIVLDAIESNEIKEYVDNLKNDSNVHYQVLKNTNIAEAYNKALKQINGEYVTFINSSIYYPNQDTFKYIEENENDIITLNVCYYDADTEKSTRYKMQPRKTEIINLDEMPYKLHTALEGYFIKRELITFKFDESLYEESRFRFLFDLWNNKREYTYIKGLTVVSTKPFEDNSSKCAIQYNKWWYTDSIKKFILPMLDEYKKTIPAYIQEFTTYLIYAKYNCNIYDRNKGVLSKDEYNEFSNATTEVIKKIDNSYIIQYKGSNVETNDDINSFGLHQFKIARWLRYVFISNKFEKLKLKKKVILTEVDSKNYINIEGIKNKKVVTSNVIGIAENETVNVFAINYRKNKLYFDCTTSIRDYLLDDEIKIYVKYNDKKIAVKQTNFYTLLKAFGETLSRKYAFSFSINVLPQNINKLEIYAEIDGKKIPLKFKYSKVQAHLSNSTRSFWHYKNFVLANKGNHIIIKKANFFNLLGLEIMFDLSKLKNVKNKKRVLKLIALRMLYYVTHPFYKNKHIWLTWDKLYKAGDNGEYIYQYGRKQGRNIYYIIKKDSPDYERLVKQDKKHIIVYNTLKAKLLCLHAETILATHANVISYCGHDGIARHFVSGFFNAEVICIQHGLTIQKIAQFQNRLFDNIKHYCCASQYEVDNILEPLYDFDKSQITLTGLARYDGLKTNDQRIILITPTWRRNVVNSSVAHIKKKHNNNFKNSDYFKIYNNLINDKKLIDAAKKNNYRIIYLLHPAMSGQLEDFDKNDYVDIIPATGDMNYEKILTESSLMVTDYSGVQFDFAYQRKVLVYYHPDKLPPHYDAGGLDYQTMGFGPVCTNETDIVNELCSYMNNNCQIKEEYKKRADKFFAFDDFNNCERIIKAVDKYLEKLK